jgi:glutamate synthase domain-containing protein 2
VYQRAKGDVDNIPFGTRRDVYHEGYEWVNHSIYPKDHIEVPRITIGSVPGVQYSAAIFNVSALSFGAISAAAIRALNLGAKRGHFYQNTGEGGVSKYHLENGGDIVWNIGTGYFSCRDMATGGFAPDLYKAVVANPSIKMTEIKLSQGAKPGKYVIVFLIVAGSD